MKLLKLTYRRWRVDASARQQAVFPHGPERQRYADWLLPLQKLGESFAVSVRSHNHWTISRHQQLLLELSRGALWKWATAGWHSRMVDPLQRTFHPSCSRSGKDCKPLTVCLSGLTPYHTTRTKHSSLHTPAVWRTSERAHFSDFCSHGSERQQRGEPRGSVRWWVVWFRSYGPRHSLVSYSRFYGFGRGQTRPRLV